VLVASCYWQIAAAVVAALAAIPAASNTLAVGKLLSILLETAAVGPVINAQAPVQARKYAMQVQRNSMPISAASVSR
jgi:hypothetical protein